MLIDTYPENDGTPSFELWHAEPNKKVLLHGLYDGTPVRRPPAFL
jgi:hypothetical protein